jgi:hypothetical protein
VLLGLYVAVLVLPGLREFFALSTLGPWAVLGVLGGVTLTVGGLALSDERFVPAEVRRRLP